MTDPETAPGRREARGARDLSRRRRIWPWILFPLIVLVALAAAAGWIGKSVYDQAQDVRTHLAAAMPSVAAAQKAMLAGDEAAASTAAASLSEETAQAVAATGGVSWDIAEAVPFGIGANVRAVRVAAEVTDQLASSVIAPASQVSIDALAPKDGRIDLANVTALAGTLDQMKAGLDAATASLSQIDRGALVDQVGTGVDQLNDAVASAQSLIGPAQQVVGLLPGALGADGPRNYLLLFQGNSEARATGGNPAAMVLLTVENGSIRIARQATSIQFHNARPQSVSPLDPETQAVYSDIIGRWVPNMTATPDFPTTVEIAKAWWAEEFDDRIDGVVSFDPVGLSYLLNATGPLPIADGLTLTSENAVPLLLRDAYVRFPYGPDADAFFASVAVTVFDALTQHAVQPKPLVEALVRAADEGRLLIWSANPAETAALDDTPLSGTLPTDNVDQSVVGVYFNDTTGSKMDYFVDASVAVKTDQCTTNGTPQWTTTVALRNGISRQDAAALPFYITGPHYTPGDIATDFVVYSPVGAHITGWKLDGQEYPALVHTTHLGRDVVRLNILTNPLSARTLEVTMTGADGTSAPDYGPTAVRHTPMVRDTPVTIDAPGCPVG